MRDLRDVLSSPGPLSSCKLKAVASSRKSGRLLLGLPLPSPPVAGTDHWIGPPKGFKRNVAGLLGAPKWCLGRWDRHVSLEGPAISSPAWLQRHPLHNNPESIYCLAKGSPISAKDNRRNSFICDYCWRSSPLPVS